MSSSVASRVRAPLRVLCRHSSSSSSPKELPRLPTEKVHALVALYHQANTFITPENLSQRIDEAFITKRAQTNMAAHVGLKTFRDKIHAEQKMGKFWEWEKDDHYVPRAGLTTTGESWSEGGLSDREARVMEALYGVDTNDPGHARLAGLDVLNDPDTIQADKLSKAS